MSGYGDLDLAPIGNCATSALIDRNGAFVWACEPRVDGDPMFCALLSGEDPAQVQRGVWSIDLIDQVSATQSYERNTPILITTLTDSRGGSMRSPTSAHASAATTGRTAPPPSSASCAP